MESEIMLKTGLGIAALALVASTGASAYETGQLTCQNIGELAAHTLLAKQSGVPPEAYLSALNERLPADARIERDLAAKITAAVYTNELLAQMKPEDAYGAFTQDCLMSQEQDEMSGQREERDGAEQEQQTQ
jgi:hypothetical protein